MFAITRKIDNFLNGITMYRLLMYGLSLLALVSIVYSATGVLDMPLGGLIITFFTVMTAGFVANQGLARLLRVPTNFESGIITCFILFFILPPVASSSDITWIAAVTALAMASKFLIAPRRAHIFNPAAFGAGIVAIIASLVAIGGIVTATWWVGSSILLPFTLIFGLLIVRKIRRFSMVGTFLVISLAASAVIAIADQTSITDSWRLAIASSPLIFLATVMLTEPSSAPHHRIHQVIYAGLVGVLYAGQFKFGPLYISPEIALLTGNTYAYAVSHKQRVRLQLQSVNAISERVRDYVFMPDTPLIFKPGQYMEVTLPDTHPDSRGNRRTFSIASSPTEPDIHLGMKFYDTSSKFKRTMLTLKTGSTLYAGQVGGDFTMPRDPATKLVFIAGGIGITPFRSMLQYLIDTRQKRDIILMYAVAASDELAYQDVIQRARIVGVQAVPLVAARLDAPAITKYVSDLANRTFYISGPQIMVGNTRRMLRKLGIPAKRIRTDYFTGY